MKFSDYIKSRRINESFSSAKFIDKYDNAFEHAKDNCIDFLKDIDYMDYDNASKDEIDFDELKNLFIDSFKKHSNSKIMSYIEVIADAIFDIDFDEFSTIGEVISYIEQLSLWDFEDDIYYQYDIGKMH